MSPESKADRGGRAGTDGVKVEVVRDGRLRTRIHWEWNGDRVRIRAPRRLPQRELDQQVDRLIEQVKRRRAQLRSRADADLETLARGINETYFEAQASWHSIRWVSNMRKRLGSCTVGGPTDGDIRISDRVKGWPEWVVGYVVAHELAHRKHPNHSREFWAFVSRYPQTERARGFVMGVAFQLGVEADDWL